VISDDAAHMLAHVTALANTDSALGGSEEIRNVDDLREFLTRRVFTLGRVDRTLLSAVRALRARLIAIADDPVGNVAEINRLLTESAAIPQVVEHDGEGPHIHYFTDDTDLIDHIVATCAISLAMLVTSGESDRLKHCAAPDCNRLFLDESKNRSRRYCDGRTCGSRLHTAAYRARKQADHQAVALTR
jgi:predicted RNA-binding Zn ribbon-like protein